jgi:hypothetical protein
MVIILPQVYLVGASVAVFLYLWLIYSFTFKILFSKNLAWIHVLVTILFFLAAIIIHNIRSTVSHVTQYNYFYNLDRILAILIAIIFFAQVLFVINIFLGFLKLAIKKHKS